MIKNDYELNSIKASDIEVGNMPIKYEKFFGYISEEGYIALKRYTTKRRYDEIKDADIPLFIPVFVAFGYEEAMQTLKKILEKSLTKFNNWNLLSIPTENENFGRWLRTQKHRDDPIGDLANDYIADNCPKDFTLKYILSKKVDKLVIKAFKSARKEFLRWLKS